MMPRKITIELPDDIAHRLEIMAAKDDLRIAQGIENLLTYLVNTFEKRR
jgi:predicted transcriptional regulator